MANKTKFDEVVEILDEINKQVIQQLRDFEAELLRDELWWDRVSEDINEYKRTGILTATFAEKQGQSVIINNTDSLQEDTNNSLKQNKVNHTETTKATEEHENVEFSVLQASVKTERHTNNFINKKIKKEMLEMPPPSNPPIRTRTRKAKASSIKPSLSLKIKTELMDEKSANLRCPRDSDVQIQPQIIDLINLDDSDECIENRPKTRARTKKRKTVTQDKKQLEHDMATENVRSTRTKTKKITENNENPDDNERKNTKRLHSTSSSENEQILNNSRPKRTKTKPKNTDNSVGSENENMLRNENSITKNTVMREKKKLDETVVVKKPIMGNGLQLRVNDIMTEDEDRKSPITEKRVRKLKQIFSPYEKIPIRTRVQAFEKIDTENNSEIPIRITRKVAQGKEVKAKPVSKGLSTATIAATRSQISLNQNKGETIQKKEALIHTLMEEKRRKLQERQLKAQQARDALIRDKQKALEAAERLKQEKIKQILAKKEIQEELASKQALAAKTKYKELKHKKIPAYNYYNTPPLLPTQDCYDSDQENKRNTYIIPTWQQKPQLYQIFPLIRLLGRDITNLFGSTPQTPNLKAMFPTIEPAKLKRTSSAVWNCSGPLRL